MTRLGLIAAIMMVSASTGASAGSEFRGRASPTQAIADPALVPVLRKASSDPETRFAIARADLNRDGTDERLVYIYGPRVCGSGGCNLLILQRERSGYRRIARTSVTRAPIRLLPTSSGGWRDLSVRVAGGGGEAGQVRLRHGRTGYSANPTLLPDNERVQANAGVLLIQDPPRGAQLPHG